DLGKTEEQAARRGRLPVWSDRRLLDGAGVAHPACRLCHVGAARNAAFPGGNQPDKESAVGLASSPTFDAVLARANVSGWRGAEPRTLQVNVGKLCNQACHHCHVDAGPTRTEIMAAPTAERVLAVLARNPGLALDLTGGAPELNPRFRRLVEGARALGR